MYERLLKQTERYLEGRKEVLVSVKQVWDVMVKEGRANNFSVPSLMADFECLLEGDKRFEFVAEKGFHGKIPLDIDVFLEHEELGKLGFSDNQKVKLRRIPLPFTEDEETVDALDGAISMEELDEELSDQALFEHDVSASTGARPAEKKKSKGKNRRAPLKNVSARVSEKIGKGASSAKKRKK